MTARRTGMLALLIAVAACENSTELIPERVDAEPGPDVIEPIPLLVSIEVTPEETVVDIDDVSLSYVVMLQAIGRFEGGERGDITSQVSWLVDDPAPGEFIEPGTWTASRSAAGVVHVEARTGDIVGRATIVVILRD